MDLEKNIKDLTIQKNLPNWDADGTTTPREWVLINHNKTELKNLMNNYVGIVRSDERLKRALNRLGLLFEETENLYQTTVLSPQLCELRNMIDVGTLIVKQSMDQKENRGTFYNVDLANV